MSNFRSPALLRLARGQSCTNCPSEDDDTTVAAHSNWADHGKGMSIKAHDCYIAFLCFRCHSWLDQGTGRDPTGRYTVYEKREMFDRARDATLLRLFQQGRLRVSA